MNIGAPFGLQPGHTSSIRRIEGGLLSYHADMDIFTNPYELGLDRLVDLSMEADFIGKTALKKIWTDGIRRKQVGLCIECDPFPGPNTRFWPVNRNGQIIGKVTSAVYSPRLKKNIALAMVSLNDSEIGTKVRVLTSSGEVPASVIEKPFFDPKKKIVISA
jgi:aminomethyltransferase